MRTPDGDAAGAACDAELNSSVLAHEMVRKPQRYRFNGLLHGERFDEDFTVRRRNRACARTRGVVAV